MLVLAVGIMIDTEVTFSNLKLPKPVLYEHTFDVYQNKARITVTDQLIIIDRVSSEIDTLIIPIKSIKAIKLGQGKFLISCSATEEFFIHIQDNDEQELKNIFELRETLIFLLGKVNKS